MLHGHKTITVNGVLCYADETPVYDPASGRLRPRPCPHCHQPPNAFGHDGCLGTLPGVRFACCGHGGRDPHSPGYIVFSNQTIIRFPKLTEVVREGVLIYRDSL